MGIWKQRQFRNRLLCLLTAGVIFCAETELKAYAALTVGTTEITQTEECGLETEQDESGAEQSERTEYEDGYAEETETGEETGRPGDSEAEEEADRPGDSETEEEVDRPGDSEAEEEADRPGDSETEEEVDRPENTEQTGEEESGEENDSNTEGQETDAEYIEEDGLMSETVSDNAIASAGEGRISSTARELEVAYRTQEEIRVFVRQSGAGLDDAITYAEEPGVTVPYSAGRLSDETLQSAVAMLNQVRYIAGLSYDVQLDGSYSEKCQAASIVNYVNRKIDHNPQKPADMEDILYQQGYQGAGSSNLGMNYGNLNEAILEGWMDDGDTSNISKVGHRRWILNPLMGKTGFGFVEGKGSNTSVSQCAMYALDKSNSSARNVFGIAWPAQNMPLEYFEQRSPWSVSLGESVDASEIQVRLTRKKNGKVWNFPSDSDEGQFYVNNESYGERGCIIFKPNLYGDRYEADEQFEVEILKNGETYMEYTVTFFELQKKLTVSGISMEGKDYDGEAVAYTGVPVLTDSAGRKVTDVMLTAFYTGTLADGSIYEKTTAAPVQAGRYTLSFEVTGTDAQEYRLDQNTYTFSIWQKEATVTAGSLRINTGEPLPEVSELQYTVEGLPEGEELMVKPSFRYSVEELSTETEGSYEIIPYGADAGNNYRIVYINGKLTIENFIVQSGTVNHISWKIDRNGKLSITGNGDYEEDGEPPWADNLRVVTAEVEVSGMTSMRRMFSGCRYLQTVELSKTDTSQVTDMSYMFSYCTELQDPGLKGLDTGKVENMSYMFERAGLENLEFDLDTANVKNMSNMFRLCSRLKNLKLKINTAGVTNMSGMFQYCYVLTSLDLSCFDMGAVERTDSSMLYASDKLTHIVTPKNCGGSVILPNSGTWYQDIGVTCTRLPQGLPYSIELYRDRWPEDAKKSVYLSGIMIADKIYDGVPNAYTGEAVMLDASGNAVSDIMLEGVYAGTLEDGSIYADAGQAPKEAGNYTLSFEMKGESANRYVLRNAVYDFCIRQKKVTITAPDRVIRTGSGLPDLSAIKDYKVSGLLEGEHLATVPSFRYGMEEISTDLPGSYEIIPYGADAGSNYYIEYVNGVLRIEEAGSGEEADPVFGDIYPEDIPADGVIPEGLWIAGLVQEGYAYTGKALKPAVRVYDYKTLLQEKRDYTIVWSRNSKAYGLGPSDYGYEEGKAPAVMVKGKGNYTGKEIQTFRILPLDISGREQVAKGVGEDIFAVDSMTIVWNGKEQKPLPDLLWNDKKLKNGKDYTLAYYKDGSSKKLDFVKEPGRYQIQLSGKGNFTGIREIALTVIDPEVDGLTPVSKLTVAKIPKQTYEDGRPDQNGTGVVWKPILTVKDGRTVLKEGIHYEVCYSRNNAAGTAYAIVTGIEEEGYSGTKRVAFKISGMPIKKATVEGLADKTFIYEGTDVEPELQLTVKRKNNGTETVDILEQDRDYTITWQKNQNAGTAAVIFTGKGRYTGTLKKSFQIGRFDIAANEGGRIEAALEDRSVVFTRGGARPKPTVTFLTGDGRIRTLAEGKDYTVSYKNSGKVTGESEARPSVLVKGKGNFAGTYSDQILYEIVPQDIGELTLTAQDKVYRNKKNIYATKVVVTDTNGKPLQAGTDYDRTLAYTYSEKTEVRNVRSGNDETVIRSAGEKVDGNDIIPAGTVLSVKVTAKENGNYRGELEGQYRIVLETVSSASVSVQKQVYTGQEITLDKSQISVKVKGRTVDDDQWEIVEGSYENNIEKGNARVTIRGLDRYGGTRTVKFAIRAKGFLWWWRK